MTERHEMQTNNLWTMITKFSSDRNINQLSIFSILDKLSYIFLLNWLAYLLITIIIIHHILPY